MIIEFGGEGPVILLLHGLMGRARTWWPVAQWLVRYGRVIGLDARAHGRNPHRTAARTEDFVADAAETLRRVETGPAVVIGHSMGALHACVLAAEYPDLAGGVVAEDMAVDQRSRTADGWRSYVETWPVPFQSLAHVREFFGTAGDYFIECVEERSDGYHLIADLDALYRIAQEWGERSYWPFMEKIQCPLLAIEAEHGIVPEGQMAEMARRVPGGGQHLLVKNSAHIVHSDQPDVYRGAVEAFLAGLLKR